MGHDENENYCLERLGINNARGDTAQRLREISPEVTGEELLARPLSRGRFLVVDLETTGMKPDRARIIEIGAVEVDGFELGRELGSLVYPEGPIPHFITALTGIDNAMAATAPRLEEVLPLLERMLRGRVLVAHNAHFDLSFLTAAWQNVLGTTLQAPILCTVKLARRTYPELKNHNLDAVTAHLKLRPPGRGAKARHRALGDARITAAALVNMCAILDRGGISDLRELLTFQSARKSPRRSRRLSTV